MPVHVTLHPAIGMHAHGEAVQILVRPEETLSEHPAPSSADDFMLVDGAEDEWLKTHDVRINGQVGWDANKFAILQRGCLWSVTASKADQYELTLSALFKPHL